MAAHDVHALIIEPMVRVFGEFGTDDADYIVATYVRQFERYDRAVLAETWDRVLADFMPSKRQPWPPVALIRKHAERAVEEISAKAERAAPKNKPHDPAWSFAAFAAADRLVMSDIGRVAAGEGWITQLHDYCRRARSLPDAGTIARMKRDARLFEDAYGQVCRGDAGILSAPLQRLGETFLRRRDELAGIVHGDESSTLTDRSRAMSGETE